MRSVRNTIFKSYFQHGNVHAFFLKVLPKLIVAANDQLRTFLRVKNLQNE